MNRGQRVAIVIGALVIAGLALFPPWYCKPAIVATGSQNPSEAFIALPETEIGRHWAFSPPPPPAHYHAPRIDAAELAGEVATLLVITVVTVLALKDQKV